MSQLESTFEHAIREFLRERNVPISEFFPRFVTDMVFAMATSYHKYGLVAKAYPEKFDAVADVRTRLSKYRETGDFWYLVDVANFAMIETMHPRHEQGHWGENDDHSSPGRVNMETRSLDRRDNEGRMLGGDGFLSQKSE